MIVNNEMEMSYRLKICLDELTKTTEFLGRWPVAGPIFETCSS